MARDFNGTSDRIDYSSAFNTTGQALTVAGWVRFETDTPTGSSRVIWASRQSGGSMGTGFCQSSAGSRILLFFRAFNTTSKTATTSSGYFASLNTWYHVAVGDYGTAGGSVDFYLNGVKTTVAVATSGTSSELTANSGFVLGGHSLDNARAFDGAEEGTAVYNRKLSDAEILALYKGAPPTSLSGLEFYTRLQGDDYKNILDASGTLSGTTVVQSTAPVIRRPSLVRMLGYGPAYSVPNITSVNGGSAVYEGQTNVALVGTTMNVSNAAARLRIVGAPSTYQLLSSYSPSDASNATATIPTLTSVPFSQTYAGVGLTTWNVEVAGTNGSDVSVTPAAVELRPAAGWDVVEIVTPDLTTASLLYYLGWTGVATDLLHWQSSVVVNDTTVAITVNNDGTFDYVSTYTVGGAPAPLPSFSWQYRGWSSSSKAWTSLATVLVGAGSGALSATVRPALRTPIRSAVRGTIQ